jgi:broad specificity phosphatase PhoE
MLGEWEGLTHPEVVARGEGEQLALYRSDSIHHRPPGGETTEDTWHRMAEAARMIREDRPTGAVAIVGHGGTLRVLICEAMGAPMTSVKRLSLDNTSLSIIRTTYRPEGPVTRVLLVNDTSHLEGG